MHSARSDVNRISILGSGWLGLPLAKYFLSLGFQVNASTTSVERKQQLSLLAIEPFVFSLNQLAPTALTFLRAPILIINIPYKNVDDFKQLIKLIEQSQVKYVVFVSSTSVYKNTNTTVTEADTDALTESPLLTIENCFRFNRHFKTTVVRMGGLIGGDRHPGRFFKNKNPVRYHNAFVNLIHQDDCVKIISQIISQGVWGEVFNCCADTHPSKREFYSQAALKLGLPEPNFEVSDENCFKIISNQKLKKMLNYTFIHPDLMQTINVDDT